MIADGGKWPVRRTSGSCYRLTERHRHSSAHGPEELREAAGRLSTFLCLRHEHRAAADRVLGSTRGQGLNRQAAARSHLEASAAHPPAALARGPRWRWDKTSANCGLVIPLMRKCRLFAARSARTDAFSLCAPASLPLIRRVSDEVSESGGPELLGRIPRRAVGGAGSFSASPSANSVGRRERGCLQGANAQLGLSVVLSGVGPCRRLRWLVRMRVGQVA
jgi:hypothetical protein